MVHRFLMVATFVFWMIPVQISFSQQQIRPLLTEKALELEQIKNASLLSEKKRAELNNAIKTLAIDEKSITKALILSAKSAKKITTDITAIEEKIVTQREEEDAIHASLKERRNILADVLAALQRMGLNPPPALLVKPEDALSSVRSAILLGAVVPQLRHETDLLKTDLNGLKRVTDSIAREKLALLDALKNQSVERYRLNALITQKKSFMMQSQAQLKAEDERYDLLASQASSLKDLIEKLQKEENQPKNYPGQNFAALRGALSLPVSGKPILTFGNDDGFGGKMAGMTIASNPLSMVLTPVNAKVLYAGPFRSYRQLLILDAGNDYHLIMGGMYKKMVSRGQNILSGEPVGVMGDNQQTNNTNLTHLPELYIELRHNGKPVDSRPLWVSDPKGNGQNAT
jgi:murein hydrolase activator